MPSTTHLLLSPRAADDANLREAIIDLRSAGYTLQTHALDGPGHATRLAEQLAHEHPHAIVAAGGDGTVNETLNGILQADFAERPALGVLPYGTANDFAAFLGLALDQPASALGRLLRARPRPADVGQANDRHFLNVATAGLAAEATSDTPQPAKSVLGDTAYSLSALLKFTGAKRPRITLTSPELNWQGELLLLVVANARLAGGGNVVAPRARLDDGRLDLVLVPDAPAREVATTLYELLINQNTEHPGLLAATVTSLDVQSDGPLSLNLDGESLEQTAYRFTVHPAAIALLVPE